MRRAMSIAAGLLVSLAAILTVLWFMQRRLIYFPFSDSPDVSAAAGLPIEHVAFRTSDGLLLNAWFVRAGGASGPRPTVLVFNGNAGNREHRLALAEALSQRGLQVLLTDYRGFGGNPGAPSERGLGADARAARAYLVSRPDVDAAKIVYFGESLGAAVAIDLAAEHPPAALVLRSPFTSMTDIGSYHYAMLPVGLLLRDRYPSLDRIGKVRVPLLVVAGDRDTIIPLEHSRRLFEAANDPKQFVVVPGADHNDYALLAGDQLIESIVRVVETDPLQLPSSR